jgi:hypothetical protein
MFLDWNFNGNASVIWENSNNTGSIIMNDSSQVQCTNGFFLDAAAPFVQNSSGTLTISSSSINGGSFAVNGAGSGLVSLTGVSLLNSTSISTSLNLASSSPTYSDAGMVTPAPANAFLYFLPTTVNNVTGNGAAYVIGTDALTQEYDFSGVMTTGGLFTAPMAGIYNLFCQAQISNCTIASEIVLTILTSNSLGDSVNNIFTRAASADDFYITASVNAMMRKGDTATFQVTTTGEAGNTDSIVGGFSPFGTWIQGNMIN